MPDFKQMKANACVVVSGLPDRVNSQKLREHFQSGDIDSGIRQVVTFSKTGAAVIEFRTPKGAADVLANEALLEVRGLVSVFPRNENTTTLTGLAFFTALLKFFRSLPRQLGTGHQESGVLWIRSYGNQNDLDMDPDACVVLSGVPDDVLSYPLCSWMRQLVEFSEIGTVLLEFSTPEGAAVFLANKRRLLEKTGVQARKLESLLSPKEDVTSLQSQLSQLQQQHKTAKQNLRSKEQQLQQVTTVNKSLQAALRREREAQKVSINLSRMLEQENTHLKNQVEADKRKFERLKEQAEADKNEIKRLKRQISVSADLSRSYEMDRDPRGVAAIINNIHFEDMAERHGAEGDTDRLREVFESLGFTVVTFTDLDHAKMVAAMKDQGKADHSNYDCFVCCIMSHGTMGKVFSSDDVGLDICELMKPVNAKKCPSLKGKPKLFFIQACQGEKSQGRESFDGDHDAKAVPFICHEADFFLGLATVPGYVARRDGDGAPYVKHLAKMLKDFGSTHDLSAIMAMVCDKMNEINDDKFGWISSNHSTLRKNVVFKAK